MDAGPPSAELQDRSVFAYCQVVGTLALESFGSGLMSPNRPRCHLSQRLHRHKRKIPEQSPGVVENFRILWIEMIQFDRHFHGFVVSLYARIGPLQLKSTHSLHLGIGRRTETFL